MSLVEVSPSIEIPLKVCSHAFRKRSQFHWRTATSVKIVDQHGCQLRVNHACALGDTQ